TLESAKNKDFICKVRAGTKGFATSINDVIPDGTRVKPGQLLMELDNSALRDQEDSQKIVVKKAQADVVTAQKDYEINKEKTETAIAKAEAAVENAWIDLDKYTGYVFDNNRVALGAVAGPLSTMVETGTYKQTLDDQ